MTLDEAIEHCNDVIEQNECKKCIDEHRQLKEWLEDYKQLKENPPLKFEELHEGMWVWDDEFKDWIKIKIVFEPCKLYPNGSFKAYHDLNEEEVNFIEFEENRFYRKQVEDDEN